MIYFCRLLKNFQMIFLFFLCRNTIRVSNSLDLDQARHSVGPHLGQNCLQRSPADDKISHEK